MTLLHEIEWEAPLIEPYRDPDAEALMRKKYGFTMDGGSSRNHHKPQLAGYELGGSK